MQYGARMPNVLTRDARRHLLEIAHAIAIQQKLDRDTPPDLLRGRPRHFDRKGRPITFGAWCGLFEANSYKVVRQTMLENRLWVSTVWLGIDHGYGVKRGPIIFETMVFDRRGDPDSFRQSVDQYRYETEQEALLGHAELVEKWSGPVPTQAAADA